MVPDAAAVVNAGVPTEVTFLTDTEFDHAWLLPENPLTATVCAPADTAALCHQAIPALVLVADDPSNVIAEPSQVTAAEAIVAELDTAIATNRSEAATAVCVHDPDVVGVRQRTPAATASNVGPVGAGGQTCSKAEPVHTHAEVIGANAEPFHTLSADGAANADPFQTSTLPAISNPVQC